MVRPYVEPMRLLSLDTSFSSLNLALIEDGRVILCFYEDSGKKTLEELPAVFRRLGIEIEDVDAFAVALGVGYLTSLRIGITFIKTLAYLTKKPVVGFENLHMMGIYTPAEERKVCLLKVSNNIFYRVFNKDSVGSVELLKDKLPEGKVVGLKWQGLGDLDFFPFSVYGGLWAYEMLQKGYKGDEPMLLEPIYLKHPV
ncbi:MAG: tRNA (adenosine(37)-N6)-threonylcarbamoyltransferase complex dimerization subunit type 1 TsaB [Aquificaceae bacterium]|nr:tRNA (adenosine(37)-N6)-threonylcarbamoyltransferase complex dimerization subunit type 1 TsaB [Aquificaceae bacterium]